MMVVILDGVCRLEHDSLDAPMALDSGDLVVIRGPDPYLIGDAQGSRPRIRILPGNQPVLMNGDEIGQSMNLGMRTWGAPAEDRETTKLLTGILSTVIGAAGQVGDGLERGFVRRRAHLP